MSRSWQAAMLYYMVKLMGIKKKMNTTDEGEWKKFIGRSLVKQDPAKFFGNHHVIEVGVCELIIVDPIKKSENGKVIYYFPSCAFSMEPGAMHYSFAKYLHDSLPETTVVFVRIGLAPKYSHEDFYGPFINYYLEQSLAKYPADRTCFIGGSSGANIAAVSSQELKKLGKPVPGDIILLSPVLDASFTFPGTDEHEKNDPMLHTDGLSISFGWWANGLEMKDPKVSPLFGDWSGLGRIMLAIAKCELFYPAAKSLENIVDKFMEHETMHDYVSFSFLPEAQEIRAEVVRRLL
jgi:acetyl esterase/lipase